MLLLILILALIWILDWSGPRYYPAYDTGTTGIRWGAGVRTFSW